eukprot:CAMPEP_0203677730 /NCGR_PEP_ID=MMETSP0090-20130426/29296_1 /ASSEMBLY_ACC=CAM_ASM_001088 /TAXON_ID=426623 /ORGANISM="Chaetoceros affinis, Strain CCMP159" /LENGTH=467 /DNA_ID=CAMNT_0050544709 /DNA_START=439 /DNA_END=1842 /DNA_ORIENTATION=-
MCNCCPPTVNALFCLWARSGCSKASVAGALTFFPPDPPLYKFARYSSDGELIPEETDIHDGNRRADSGSAAKGKAKVKGKGRGKSGEEKYYDDIAKDDNDKHNDDDDDDDSDDINNADNDDPRESLNRISSGKKPAAESMITPKTKVMKRDNDNNDNNHGMDESDDDDHDDDDDLEQKNVHPAKALTDRALALRKRAKIVNERDNLDAKNGIIYKFIPDPRLTRPPSFSGRIEAVKIGPHHRTKNFVAALIYRVRADRVTERTKTIIYSHGNATDIGAMYFMQVVLAKGLQCNVIMYDYSGYGESGGVPLENNTYNDVEMVYDHAINNVVQNGDERQIVIYGQSVGSGPSCYICSQKPSVGGLILHSPFMSGMRVLTPSRALACLDIFPNINRIKYVKCPVMVIHGVLDEEVHISHGKALHDAVPEDLKRNPWWVRDRGHNDITDGRAKLIEYVQRLKSFFESLERS